VDLRMFSVDLRLVLVSPSQIPLDPPFSKWEVLRCNVPGNFATSADDGVEIS